MKKALVAYFSASGETKKLAKTIAGVTGGAIACSGIAGVVPAETA